MVYDGISRYIKVYIYGIAYIFMVGIPQQVYLYYYTGHGALLALLDLYGFAPRSSGQKNGYLLYESRGAIKKRSRGLKLMTQLKIGLILHMAINPIRSFMLFVRLETVCK